MINKFRYMVALLTLVLLHPSLAFSETLRPYVLAWEGTGQVEEKTEEVRSALSGQGFEIVGDYVPYSGAHILVVTNGDLKANASQSEFGAYGAVQRVAVSQSGSNLQVSFTNPVYMANVYRMKNDLSAVDQQLRSALGDKASFGSEKGLSAKELRKYHYMFGMPYFDDPITLASHGSFKAAVDAVEKGLSAGKGGTKKIYRVDVPGKEEAVFGVATNHDEGIMGIIDGAPLKHTAYLPYELVVSGGKVYMLHGRFRIALSFPDLTMGTFTKIMSAPGNLEDALKAASK